VNHVEGKVGNELEKVYNIENEEQEKEERIADCLCEKLRLALWSLSRSLRTAVSGNTFGYSHN
jgi:hypothetical protein